MPHPHSQLIGRERALASLLTKLTPGLTSIIGPGGIGKTALAEAVALQRPEHQRVRLTVREELTQPQLEQLLAQAIPADQPPKLIIIDCGASTPAALSATIAAQLPQHPQHTWLITTRTPLKLRAERLLPLEALSCAPAAPDQLSDAATLLYQLSTARGAILDRQDAAQRKSLEAIVHELGGVPLAIELASWRMRLLGPQALLELLGQDLNILTQQLIDMTSRHRSYPALLKHQWESLHEQEQRALLRCAAFQGEFSLEQACVALECAPSVALNIIEGLLQHSALKLEGDAPHALRLSWWPASQRELLNLYPQNPETTRAHALLIAHTLEQAQLAHAQQTPQQAPPPLAILEALEAEDTTPAQRRDALELLLWRGLSLQHLERLEAALERDLLVQLALDPRAPDQRALHLWLSLLKPWLKSSALRAQLDQRLPDDPYQQLPSPASLADLYEPLRHTIYALAATHHHAPHDARPDAPPATNLPYSHAVTETWRRAQQAISAHDFAQAKQAIERLCAANATRQQLPIIHQARYDLAALHLWSGDTAPAITILEQQIAQDPQDVKLVAALFLSALLAHAGQWHSLTPPTLTICQRLGLQVTDARWWRTLRWPADATAPQLALVEQLAISLATPNTIPAPQNDAAYMAAIIHAIILTQRHGLSPNRQAIERWRDALNAKPTHHPFTDLIPRVLWLTIDALQRQHQLHSLADALSDDSPRATIDLIEDRFRIGEQGWVGFGHRPKLKRLIEVLLEAQRAQTPQLSAHEVIAQVWPDERLNHDSALARLYNLIAALRQIGWRELLVHDNEGYTLSDKFIITVRWPETST